MKKQNIALGVIIGNRNFFPDKLVSEARAEILHVMENQGTSMAFDICGI